MYSGVFYFFSTQNQVKQIIIGLGSMKYHFKALSVLTRSTLKNFQNFFAVLRETGVKFLTFSSYFARQKASATKEQAYLCSGKK